LFYHVDGEQNEMIAIWGNNKKDGQCQNTLQQLEKLKTKNGWKMEMYHLFLRTIVRPSTLKAHPSIVYAMTVWPQLWHPPLGFSPLTTLCGLVEDAGHRFCTSENFNQIRIGPARAHLLCHVFSLSITLPCHVCLSLGIYQIQKVHDLYSSFVTMNMQYSNAFLHNQVAHLWAQNPLLNNFLCSLAHMEQTNPLLASNIHDGFSSWYTWLKNM